MKLTLSDILVADRTSLKAWEIRPMFDRIFPEKRITPVKPYAQEVQTAAMNRRDPKPITEFDNYYEFAKDMA